VNVITLLIRSGERFGVNYAPRRLC
jgi:hypothetical protein